MEQYTLRRHLAGTSNAHLPHSDLVISIASEEGLTISRPGQGGHLGRLSAGRARHLWPQILHKVLALEVPDLDVLVPSGGDNDGIGGVRGEPDTADPVRVALITDGVLALGQGVPQLDGLIPAG